MSVVRSARERVHEEVSAEILAVARTHLAREGGVALSLRSIARDVGMAPSALYRYYSGRDALLSALILSAYTSLADEAERVADQAEKGRRSDRERFAAVPRAMRTWALEHPHEWSLIFGTPVPGYEAPQETVVLYARVASALVRPIAAADEAGRLIADNGTRLSAGLRASLAPVIDAFEALPPAVVVSLVEAWATVTGAISLELFGHWRNTVLEPAVLFDEFLSRLGASFGLP
ncbi:MAG TPA: TetR/AcrR family transcriptional regulator [Acidimicrobiales bacterium]|jgi:AcrR family transcriptional regulator